jgi:3-isopropylmalate/(R)-2-methylmalate dehydratase small subunit
MQPFTSLTAIAAPMPQVNIDTDAIIPKQFLRTIERSGLGKAAFYEWRYNDDGSEKADFVLNREPYRHANIIVAGDNFGCGSSREHAPWALLDFGIRAVIAPSFADIFHSNCFKNGILPIALPQAEIDKLMADAAAGREITIDLVRQKVVRHVGNNEEIPFDVDPFRKHCLLEGLDDIGLTLAHAPAIDAYEAGRKAETPWLFR